MKITIAAEIFPPSVGGPATYAAALASCLHRRDLLGGLVFYRPGASGSDGLNFWVSSDQGKAARVVEYTRVLRSLPSTSIVYAQGMVASGLPALLASRSLRLPLVVRCPGDFSWEVTRRTEIADGLSYVEDTASQSLSRGRLFQLQVEILTNAHALIVPCDFMRRVIRAWGIDESKISVIRNAPYLPPGLRNVRGMRDPRFLVIARLTSWKGIDSIVRAFAEARSSMPGALLTIVGEGPCAGEAERLLARLGISDHVELKPFLPRTMLLMLLAKSLALVVNSGYECSSNVVAEALAVGTPVIACSSQGIHERLSAGLSALLFDRNDQKGLAACMVSLWESRLLWKTLQENGLKLSDEYTFDDMMDSTMRTMKAIAGS
jgi:glycosyltransferase involved in cell wall biosynthesis